MRFYKVFEVRRAPTPVLSGPYSEFCRYRWPKRLGARGPWQAKTYRHTVPCTRGWHVLTREQFQCWDSVFHDRALIYEVEVRDIQHGPGWPAAHRESMAKWVVGNFRVVGLPYRWKKGKWGADGRIRRITAKQLREILTP